MATLSVQKGNGDKPAPVVSREWEPFRALRELMSWDPFAAMMPGALTEPGEFAPAFEVKETPNAFVFKADLPGVKESDLEVSLNNNRLSISGKRESEKSDKGDTYYTYERSYGSFTRSFTLPEGVKAEEIKAKLKEGVLTVELPKHPEAQPKKIDVKNG